MTRVFYPDFTGTSPDGRFALEARSPANGTIPLPDGQPAPRPRHEPVHQRGFRYQFLELPGRRVCWERWQTQAEDSPCEALVSNDGWCILVTGGFLPELIAVSPSGSEALRVRIVPPKPPDSFDRSLPPVAASSTPTVDWIAQGAESSTAGISWSRHSLPYFLRHEGNPFFVWRTAWDERLVLLLEPAAIIPEHKQQGTSLATAMDEQERRWARELLQGLQPRLADRELPNQRYTLDPMRLAFHLVGVHSMTDCLALIQPWDRFDLPDGGYNSLALEGARLTPQALRPILNHSLQHLGAAPSRLPAYDFTLRKGGQPLTSGRRVEDRVAQAMAVDSSMPARQVLELMGSPDHVHQEWRQQPGEYDPQRVESWEFDFQLPTGWQTLTLAWAYSPEGSRLQELKRGASPWLESPYRVRRLLESS